MTSVPDPRRAWVLEALTDYWPASPLSIGALPMPEITLEAQDILPPPLTFVSLPSWAKSWEANGGLLVPSRCVVEGPGEAWRRVDWLSACAWYLQGLAERAHEERQGPVHSYAFRLRGWDPRLWDRAWVNRIALFLRAWAARETGRDENELLGPRPKAKVHLGHDVDAVKKTLAIRAKQGAFQLFNAARHLTRLSPLRALSRAAGGLGFMVRGANYWGFDLIRSLEEQRGLRSTFHVYAGGSGWGRGPKSLLFDPGYGLDHEGLTQTLRGLADDDWTLGLHPAFGSWEDAGLIREEKSRLERALGRPVSCARQHWLRFSWKRTWKAQAEAGLEQDSTLGFNDRPGFRNGAALSFNPWDPQNKEEMNFRALPLLFMDSHFYDYNEAPAPGEAMRPWLEELKAVGGEAALLWHTQVMNPDYGWTQGYVELLDLIRELGL